MHILHGFIRRWYVACKRQLPPLDTLCSNGESGPPDATAQSLSELSKWLFDLDSLVKVEQKTEIKDSDDDVGSQHTCFNAKRQIQQRISERTQLICMMFYLPTGVAACNVR